MGEAKGYGGDLVLWWEKSNDWLSDALNIYLVWSLLLRLYIFEAEAVSKERFFFFSPLVTMDDLVLHGIRRTPCAH